MCCSVQETSSMSCCEENPGSGAAADVQAKFQEFMKAAAAPGKLDARTKRATSVALSIVVRCEPCARIHVRKAKEEGFSDEEIDEAAMMAVSFGGCSAMMFYNELKKRP
ncbi:MAG: carboxymuconolactone decarboxylase family protein [Planctomycetota bacterium]